VKQLIEQLVNQTNSQNAEFGTSKVTTAISRNGFEFDYLQDHWVLSRNVTINMQLLSDFEEKLMEKIRYMLVYFAENQSATTTKSFAAGLRLFLRLSGKNEFSVEAFVNFYNALEKRELYKLSVVRNFIRHMRYLGVNENVPTEVYQLTDKWTLGGIDKGVAVLSLDPETGPFSDYEFEAIGFNAAHKFAENKITTEQYALTLLFKSTGRRPEQIATLKVKDFSLTNEITGSLTYVVNIPRIKQTGGAFRTSLKPFGLIKTVGQIVESQIQETISRVQLALGKSLSTTEVGELPLFMSDAEIEELVPFTDTKRLAFLKSELSHQKSANISAQLVTAVELLGVVSERTGEPIKVISYRFRYTLGTRAAKEGAGVLTIATLLDHSNANNVGFYVANVPEHAIEISKIMNQPLAKYASGFAGKLVAGEAEANIENPGATRIPLHEKDCDIGSCGTSAFCQDNAPIACYVCPKFRPWKDAPHHLVLEWLMEERERLKRPQDMTIAAINDRVIVAVCQVMKLCNEANNV
jgi:integrase